MSDLPFDAAQAVKFDINRGLVSAGAGDPRLLVPVAAVSLLLADAQAETVDAFARKLGEAAADSIYARVGNIVGASLAAVVDQLGGELALSGLGSMNFERWGAALVVRVVGCPLGEAGPSVLSAFLEELIKRLWARSLRAVVLEQGADRTLRLLLCGGGAASKVVAWQAEQVGVSEILLRLNQDESV